MNQQHFLPPALSRIAVISGVIVLIALLGMLDYFTGDYSLVIFYLLPIAVASWYVGLRFGLATAFLCGGARFLSDYFLHGPQSSSLHAWNLLVEFLFFCIVAVLVTALYQALNRQD